jgi:HAD superfamily hydrolase (TIGR01490 family)
MSKKTVAAFDFDGTITNKDTFLLFIIFTKGKIWFIVVFLLYLPLIVAFKLGIYSNRKLKQKIFSFCFKGTSIEKFNDNCAEFFKNNRNIIRVLARDKILEHKQNNDELIIISASIENWVRPFADYLGIKNIVCTKLEVDDCGILTGNFSTSNCYGVEKVDRLLNILPNRNEYYLISYGDSKGDKDLLKFSDEGHYRVFD